jgi:hypothetical protein
MSIVRFAIVAILTPLQLVVQAVSGDVGLHVHIGRTGQHLEQTACARDPHSGCQWVVQRATLRCLCTRCDSLECRGRSAYCVER